MKINRRNVNYNCKISNTPFTPLMNTFHSYVPLRVLYFHSVTKLEFTRIVLTIVLCLPGRCVSKYFEPKARIKR